MHCPSCGNPAVEGDTFCGSCGAALPGPQAVQPTQQMPQVPQAQAAPAAPVGQQYAAGPPPKAGLGAGVIVAIVLAAVLVIGGVATGGFFAWRALRASDTAEIPVAVDETSELSEDLPTEPAVEPSGFATPEEALADSLPEGWVSDILTNETELKEYITGPPNSEYTDVVVVAQQPDGSWLVEDTYAYDTGDAYDDSGDSTMSPEDEATQVVGEFLYAVKQDRADDAHAYTISPFAEDPASAQFSNGDLTSIEVTDAQLQADGTTVLVWSKEVWTWGTEQYIYVCVPTDAGYRISELRVP